MTDEMAILLKRVRRSEILTSLLFLALSLAVISGFAQAPRKARFDSIDVERINVVEKDGMVRLVISNSARAPGWVIGGKLIPGRPKSAGMIFYDDQGIEDGGLVFGSKVAKGHYYAAGSLTFDQHSGDQVVALQYNDEDGERRNGLAISEFPRGYSLARDLAARNKIAAMAPSTMKDSAMMKMDSMTAHGASGVTRGYFGRDRGGSSVLRLADANGNARVRLLVDSTGSGRLEFLDGQGHVTHVYPTP